MDRRVSDVQLVMSSLSVTLNATRIVSERQSDESDKRPSALLTGTLHDACRRFLPRPVC